MALFRFSPLDPVSDLLALQRELDRVFDNPLGVDFGFSARGVFPPANVFSDQHGCVVRLEVPGVPPDQLHVGQQGRTLTVSGKREFATPSPGGFHRHERGRGEFSRSLQLPEDVDLTKTEASYKHGILTLRIPKQEEAKPRQITVQAA